jgi:hypothetical protein
VAPGERGVACLSEHQPCQPVHSAENDVNSSE